MYCCPPVARPVLGTFLVPLLLGGCTASAPVAPATGPGYTGSPAPGTCSVLRMEHSEREMLVTGNPVNSTSVVLVFRPPGEGHEAELSTKVEVQRELVQDLRARLETQPEVICEPDPAAPGGYRLSMPQP